MTTEQMILLGIILLMSLSYFIRTEPRAAHHYEDHNSHPQYPPPGGLHHSPTGEPHSQGIFFEKLIATLAALTFVWYLVAH